MGGLRSSATGLLQDMPPRGIEPPANGLGNRCSIHLSYGGQVVPEKLNRSTASAKRRSARGGISGRKTGVSPTTSPPCSRLRPRARSNAVRSRGVRTDCAHGGRSRSRVGADGLRRRGVRTRRHAHYEACRARPLEAGEPGHLTLLGKCGTTGEQHRANTVAFSSGSRHPTVSVVADQIYVGAYVSRTSGPSRRAGRSVARRPSGIRERRGS